MFKNSERINQQLRKILDSEKVQKGKRQRDNEELYQRMNEEEEISYMSHVKRMVHRRLTYNIRNKTSERPSCTKWTTKVDKDSDKNIVGKGPSELKPCGPQTPQGEEILSIFLIDLCKLK